MVEVQEETAKCSKLENFRKKLLEIFYIALNVNTMDMGDTIIGGSFMSLCWSMLLRS